MLTQFNTFHEGYKLSSTYKNSNHSGSDKYNLVQTGAVIEMIKQNYTFDVVTYQEGRTLKNERYGQQSHLVRMRDTTATERDVVPEIIIINSYDTSKAFTMQLGFFRFVCMNGLIAGTSLGGYSSKHLNLNYEAIFSFLREFPLLASKGFSQVREMQGKVLSDEAFKQLALETYKVKLGVPLDKDISRSEKVVDSEVSRLLRSRRYADDGKDAFTRMNVIQENILKGRRGGYGTLRRVTAVDKTVKLNRFLWDRTLELAA